MPRMAGALLAIVMLLGMGACPVPLRSLLGADSPLQDDAADAPDYAQAEVAGTTAPPPPGGFNEPVGQAATGEGQDAAPASAAAPSALPVGPQAPGAGAPQIGPQRGADTPGSAMPPGAGGVGPLAPAQDNAAWPSPATAAQGPFAPQQPAAPTPAPQYGALDAENFMGDAPAQTVWGQDKPKLSEDALSFAGRWLVAVIHRQDEARMLDNNAEWVLDLGRDGAFYAKQERSGQTWRQSGTWELQGMRLLLHSGPGGERAYELSQEMEHLCVLRDAERATALFCVRDEAQAKPPSVQATYDTDFGVLNLRPAGPGHWRGSYGEPAGTLLLAQLGRFLVGTWDQAPSKGFVLLELREGGFAGAWLYQHSISFDGRWVGVAAH